MKLHKMPNPWCPPGYWPIEAFANDKEIVICGEPDENDVSHNCDFMGCGMDHVLIRLRIEDVLNKRLP